MLKMIENISCGCNHLEKLGIVHRNLAARNCFVSGESTIKIGDFGIAFQIGLLCKNQEMPYRWLALECFKDNQFDFKTYVWAFGVDVLGMYFILKSLFYCYADPYGNIFWKIIKSVKNSANWNFRITELEMLKIGSSFRLLNFLTQWFKNVPNFACILVFLY